MKYLVFLNTSVSCLPHIGIAEAFSLFQAGIDLLWTIRWYSYSAQKYMEQMLMIRLPTQGEIGERESPPQLHGHFPFYRLSFSVVWKCNLFRDMWRKPWTSTENQILEPDLWSWIVVVGAVIEFLMTTKWLNNLLFNFSDYFCVLKPSLVNRYQAAWEWGGRQWMNFWWAFDNWWPSCFPAWMLVKSLHW